ncbi:hypothetical protein FA15DRAFT_711058 [Coprinopsis marcescibilis]|uniref:Uncharacterized protein n=1 Tax=Coprinopsis marcescibilis TaxID=230819 RepID=A0A5C3KB55_COPMA|nr:hypothetical protein FA15DRAFT_711058 [Coprinopsis marcescibilis]
MCLDQRRLENVIDPPPIVRTEAFPAQLGSIMDLASLPAYRRLYPPAQPETLSTVEFLSSHSLGVKTWPWVGLVAGFPECCLFDKRQKIIVVAADEWRIKSGSGSHTASVKGRPSPAVNKVIRLMGQDENQRIPSNSFFKWENRAYQFNAWLGPILQMAKEPDAWEIEVWDQDRLVKACLGSRDREALELADIVYGGIDWDVDISQVVLFLSPRAMILPSECRNQRLDIASYQAVFLYLAKLSEGITVWPNPSEMYIRSSKIRLNHHLRYASLSLGKDPPQSIVLADEEEEKQWLQRICVQGFQAVLKRDFSDCGKHVFLPGSSYGDSEKRMKEIRKEEARYWDRQTGAPLGGKSLLFPRPKWLVQPYVRELTQCVEIRVFIIRGNVLRVVSTTPLGGPGDGFSWEEPLLPPIANLDDDQVLNWGVRKSSASVADASREWELEAVNYLDKLILVEERKHPLRSGLRLFARMDMSIYKSAADGKYHYFVNEVHRGTSTDWFAHEESEARLELLWKELVKGLYYATFSHYLSSVPEAPPCT